VLRTATISGAGTEPRMSLARTLGQFRYANRAATEARVLISEHHDALAAVATRLLERGELPGHEVHDIIRATLNRQPDPGHGAPHD
jgi:hypothetical protein